MRIFIDCGAHEGGDAAKLHVEADRYVLFEPNFIDVTKAPKGAEVVRAAVWTYDGMCSFYVGEDTTGGTIVGGKLSGAVDYTRPRSVQCIDFAKWLSGTVTKEDDVVVKMDIEGAEFKVLQRLILTHAIDLVDELWVEFHANKTPYTTEDMVSLVSELVTRIPNVHIVKI